MPAVSKICLFFYLSIIQEVIATLKDKFDFGANVEGFTRDEFISLLFAMGFVTIKDICFNEIVFTIPNYVIKHLYFNYFQKEIEQQGIKQIQSYLQLDDIKALSQQKNNLKSYLIISDGDNLKMLLVNEANPIN